jgi:chromosome segregation ATPase
MHYRRELALLCATLLLASLAIARVPVPSPQVKDYLTESEADKIRDADTPALRIKLYISFAEDRLKKFEYEIHRTVPERRRAEILNALLNGYSGCVDDAADQIDVAQEKQQDIREALKMMRAKNKEFLETLQKYEKDGPELDTYRETLEDAIDGTKDALSDIDDAEKQATPGPVRRKPS